MKLANQESMQSLPIQTESDGTVWIPIDRVLKYSDVLHDLPWNIQIDSMQFRDLESSLAKNGNVRNIPVGSKEQERAITNVIEHAKRCAYFVNSPQYDPISIDVGIPGHCDVHWIVEDGNHRLYGRSLAGDQYICAFVSGSVDLAREMFDVAL